MLRCAPSILKPRGKGTALSLALWEGAAICKGGPYYQVEVTEDLHCRSFFGLRSYFSIAKDALSQGFMRRTPLFQTQSSDYHH